MKQAVRCLRGRRPPPPVVQYRGFFACGRSRGKLFREIRRLVGACGPIPRAYNKAFGEAMPESVPVNREITDVREKTNRLCPASRGLADHEPFEARSKSLPAIVWVNAKAPLVINSDAHAIGELDWMEFGVSTARRGWATAADVENTKPLGAMLEHIERRRRTERPR